MLHLKFKSKDYGRVLFNSDSHVNHNKDFLFSPRGFSTWQEHSAFIRKEFASLREDDLLFSLGDLALNSTPEYVADFLDEIPCETYLINGNHPSGVKQAYQAAYDAAGFPAGGEFFPLRIAKNVTHLGDHFLLDVDRNKFYCIHMAPLIWEEQGKRNRKCLTAHSHNSLTPANPGENGLGEILDVGVDNAIKYNGTAFFDLLEVNEIMKKKLPRSFDHHA